MEPIVVVIAVLVAFYLVFKLFKTLLKWLVLGVVVVVAIAYFSNPDSKAHKDKFTSMGKELSHDIKGIKFDDYKILSKLAGKDAYCPESEGNCPFLTGSTK